jgi:tryptophan synthase alpha chain
MSRLDDTFAKLRARRATGLITYVTAADPDFVRSASVMRALDRAGADVIEVGVPFSDPVADGPVIERAAERARSAGGTLASTLDLLADVRPSIRAPLVLFTYVNPLLAMGEQAFARRAAAAGVDGVLVLDLPVEEAASVHVTLASAGIDMIFLLSPTTSDWRIERAAALGRGFLYAISRLGVTGARDTLPESAPELVERIRARTRLPIAVGFGLSRPEHVRQVGAWADAAVVGSALVSVIETAAELPDFVGRIENFVRWLKDEPGMVEEPPGSEMRAPR